jgi:hypothetical protein
MLIEHFYYSAALAILAGMVYLRATGRDPSWIIILCAFVPDLDMLLPFVQGLSGIRFVIDGALVHHGAFHNIWALTGFVILATPLLVLAGVKARDAALFAGIGFAAHLVEDALVYKSAYPFFWPFLSGFDSFGLYQYTNDLIIADSRVFILGVALLLLASMLRTAVEGPAWVRHYLPGGLSAPQ